MLRRLVGTAGDLYFLVNCKEENKCAVSWLPTSTKVKALIGPGPDVEHKQKLLLEQHFSTA